MAMIRLTIEYDPDWSGDTSDLTAAEKQVLLTQAAHDWAEGHVTIQDLDQASFQMVIDGQTVMARVKGEDLVKFELIP